MQNFSTKAFFSDIAVIRYYSDIARVQMIYLFFHRTGRLAISGSIDNIRNDYLQRSAELWMKVLKLRILSSTITIREYWFTQSFVPAWKIIVILL